MKQVVDGVVTLPERFLAQQYVDTAVLHQFFVFLIVVKGDHRNGAFPLQLLQGFAYAWGAAWGGDIKTVDLRVAFKGFVSGRVSDIAVILGHLNVH